MKKPAFIDAQNFGVEEQFYVEELSITKSFPLHRHSFAEFEYIVDGEGIDMINGTPYQLKKGSLSFKLPWHVHELIPEREGKLHIYKCSFRLNFIDTGGMLQNLNDMVLQCFDYTPVAYFCAEMQEKIEHIYKEMLEEKTSFSLWRDEINCARITELVIYFLRNVMDNKLRQKGKVETKEAFSVFDIVRQINSRYREEDLSVKEIADKVFYSEEHLNKLLKEQVGLSFKEILMETRVRNACNLLIYTSYPIDGIAKWVGYKSRSGLYEAFESLKGISPANYRKQYNSMDKKQINALSTSQIYPQVLYYLHTHYSEDLTLEIVANQFHYNKVYFSNMLADYGTAFSDLLEEIRIYNACTLLLTSDTKVEEIGSAVGFDSVKTFYRSFKRIRGCTPGEYRKVELIKQSNICK